MKKYLIVFVGILALVSAGSLFSQGLPNKEYQSNCLLPIDLKQATVMDMNKDGHYETMQTLWCDLDNGIEFPIISPIIYPIEGSRGTPINDVADEPLPWKKLRKKPRVIDFKIEFSISVIIPTVLYDYEMREGDMAVYYTQYVPYSDVKEENPANISMSPNPAYSNADLTINLQYDNQVIVKIYAQNGQFVGQVDDSFRTAGENNLVLNTEALSSGVYFVHTTIGTQTFVNSLFVVK